MGKPRSPATRRSPTTARRTRHGHSAGRRLQHQHRGLHFRFLLQHQYRLGFSIVLRHLEFDTSSEGFLHDDPDLSLTINRTDAWRDVRPLVTRVVRNTQKGSAGADLVERARSTLLEHVVEEVNGRVSAGAALMGVTPPTYKRWVQARGSQGRS